MRLLFTTLLSAVILSSVWAQFQYTPRNYFSSCNKELEAFRLKAIDCFQANWQAENPAEIESRRALVEERLELAVAKIKALPAYRGDSSLREQYRLGMDSLLIIFKRDYKKMLQQRRYRNQSLAALEAYYHQMSVIETSVVGVEAQLTQAEYRFADQQSFKIDRSADHNLLSRYEEMSRHLRSLNRLYHGIDFPLQEFMSLISENPNRNLDTFQLPQGAAGLLTAVEQALQAAEGSDPGLLEPALRQALISFLRDTRRELKSGLSPIAEKLAEHPYHTTAAHHARIDFQFFSEKYDLLCRRFLSARQYWLEETLANMDT